MPKYDFISDPGHGWLKVPRSEVNSLGIGPKVSSFSYEQGDYVYLEEDCDASLFVEAKKAKNEACEFNFIDIDRMSPIRRMNRFSL